MSGPKYAWHVGELAVFTSTSFRRIVVVIGAGGIHKVASDGFDQYYQHVHVLMPNMQIDSVMVCVSSQSHILFRQ